MPQVDIEPFEIEFVDRFGQKLKADVYLPKGQSGPVPVLLAASPYQKSLRHLPAHWMFASSEYGPIQLYLDEGYAYVILDLPGSGVSEGEWDPWSIAEGNSTHDAIEFIASQDWSTGKIGMIGQSYFAMSQWNVARTRPPHLTTIVPYDGANDNYRDWMYHGGIPIQGFLGQWMLASVMYQHFAEGHDAFGGGRHKVIPSLINHPLDDDWWHERSPYWGLDKVDIPTFSIGVWGKGPLHLRGNFNGYEKVTGPKKLLVAEPDSFAGAQRLFDQVDFHKKELLPWYDFHLKGIDNGVMDKPNVRYFVKNAGSYGAAETWPPAGVSPKKFFLSGTKSDLSLSLNNGTLQQSEPGDEDSSTSWRYPDPLWMAGTTTIIKGVPDHTARINTYTTAPFSDEMEFTGNGVLELFASSDQTDFEVFGKLSLMLNGTNNAQKVTQGWLRASHRYENPYLTQPMRPFHTHDREERVAPHDVVKLRVELLPMSVRVKPGDRLRLELTNADSTALDQPMIHWYGQKVGTDTYWHHSEHPSCLILPFKM